MEDFLHKHLALANKNNQIEIHFGNKINEHMFNSNMKETVVKDIISKVKNLTKTKIYSKNYIISKYFYGNEEYVLVNNELIYNIITPKDYCITNDFMLYNKFINSDSYIIPSRNDYNKIEENIEMLDIIINSNIITRIQKYNNKYSVALIINKPNSPEFIKNMINKII